MKTKLLFVATLSFFACPSAFASCEAEQRESNRWYVKYMRECYYRTGTETPYCAKMQKQAYHAIAELDRCQFPRN